MAEMCLSNSKCAWEVLAKTSHLPTYYAALARARGIYVSNLRRLCWLLGYCPGIVFWAIDGTDFDFWPRLGLMAQKGPKVSVLAPITKMLSSAHSISDRLEFVLIPLTPTYHGGCIQIRKNNVTMPRKFIFIRPASVIHEI